MNNYFRINDGDKTRQQLLVLYKIFKTSDNVAGNKVVVQR